MNNFMTTITPWVYLVAETSKVILRTAAFFALCELIDFMKRRK